MGVLYGLVAALCFGSGDFAITVTARQRPLWPLFFSIQLYGLLVAGLAAILTVPIPQAPLSVWLLMAAVAFANFAGTLLLYRAFAVGLLAIVSPIGSGFAVVTALLALLGGERLPLPVLLGAGLLIVGVAVVSATGSTPGSPDSLSTHGSPGSPGSKAPASVAGVPEAIGAAICIGVYFWAMDGIAPTLGWLWPVVVTRAVQLVGAAVALAVIRQRPLGLDRSTAPLMVAALLESTALAAVNLGLDATYTSTTTALTSLYSAVSVVLAWVVLRERLAPSQWLGIAVIIGGVFLVSASPEG